MFDSEIIPAPSAASETTGLDSATTEVYRKRLRFRGTQRRLPQALIIGVRKCGTRALLEMLNLHPYIQKNGAEMHFFDDDERYANGIEWYRKKMPYSFDNQVSFEVLIFFFILNRYLFMRFSSALIGRRVNLPKVIHFNLHLKICISRE